VSARVLVADDHAGTRELCRVALEEAGLEVLEAGDGYAALELARRERPELLLLDVMMPGLDGLRVAEILRREDASVPVAFLSARAAFEDQVAGIERGAVEYIAKPFDPDALRARVLELLDGAERA
jgi:two-component system alkaline phosphatase synthesis response regulator PhoP